MDFAPVLLQPLGQHDHGVAHGRRTGLAVVQPLVAVQDEHALFVRVDDLLPEISALDGGRQVDFAGGQPPEHDGRYAQVHGVADVTVGELHRAAAVQYEHLTLAAGRQLGGQPVAAHANVGQQARIVFGRHLVTDRGTRRQRIYHLPKYLSGITVGAHRRARKISASHWTIVTDSRTKTFLHGRRKSKRFSFEITTNYLKKKKNK